MADIMDTMELQQIGARPSVGGLERALASFRRFPEEGDDSKMYLEPLREFLQGEGDIAGELTLTEEHLKKLKFNFTELYTKARFLECVHKGSIDESAELSAELGAPRARPPDTRAPPARLLRGAPLTRAGTHLQTSRLLRRRRSRSWRSSRRKPPRRGSARSTRRRSRAVSPAALPLPLPLPPPPPMPPPRQCDQLLVCRLRGARREARKLRERAGVAGATR